MDADEIDTEIRKIFDTWEAETAAALTTQTGEIAGLAALEVLEDLNKGQRTRYTRAVVDGVTDKIMNEYKEGMSRGGSVCVDAVYRDIGGGRIRATTKASFIPWLDDFKEEQIKTIGDMFIEGQKQGVYPLDMVKDLNEYFDGTYHRAVTAARTEAQKIRTTARMESYRKSGIKYVQYITAEDDRVRPEHAARNGKVYPIDKAPLLGEYNCRCILTDADYLVEEEGAPVQESEAEVLDLEELPAGIDKEALIEEIKEGEKKQPQSPAKLTYDRADNITDAEKALKDLGYNVNFKGLSLDAANDVVESIINNINIAPKIRDNMKDFGTIGQVRKILQEKSDQYVENRLKTQYSPKWYDTESKLKALTKAIKRLDPYNMLLKERSKRNTLAYSDDIQDSKLGVFFRGVFLNNTLLSEKKMSETLKAIKRDVDELFHPMGCAKLKAYIDHELGHEIDRAYKISNDGIINRLYDKRDKSPHTTAKEILATYPDTYTDREDRLSEFIAEAWAEYLNNPKPREMAQSVGDRILQIIEENPIKLENILKLIFPFRKWRENMANTIPKEEINEMRRELSEIKKELTAAGLDPEAVIKKMLGNKTPEEWYKENYHEPPRY